MTTANKLTIMRIALIPVFLVVLYWDFAGARWWALGIFIIACLTDFADGYIARHYNQITNFGKFMDPLADKMLVMAAMCYFVECGQMPGWCLAIVLLREFAVSGLRMVAAGAKDGKVIAANMWGKVKTVLQMLSIIFYFFGMAIAANVSWDATVLVVGASVVLCWLVAAVTAISGIKYLWDNRSFINTAK